MRYPEAQRRQQVWESGSLVGKPHTDSGSRPRVVGIKDLTDLLKGSETGQNEDLTKRHYAPETFKCEVKACFG